MKIKYETEDFNIRLELSKDCLKRLMEKTGNNGIALITKAVEQIAENLTNQLEVYLQETNVAPTKIEAVATKTLSVPLEVPMEESSEFRIRNRIPNEIDLNTLEVKQAELEKTLCRCPNCGQAHVAVVLEGSDNLLLVRDYEADEFVYVQTLTNDERVGLTKNVYDNNYIDYYHDIQSMLSYASREDVIVEDSSCIFCPVCMRTANFSEWKDAYQRQSKYFEYEKICDICGGEVLPTITKENSKTTKYECEQCHFIKEEPNAF